MTDKELDLFLKECGKRVIDAHKKLVETYDLNRFKKYKFNQSDETLTLIAGEDEKLVFDVICIGSWKQEDTSWVWAWGNENFHEGIRKKSEVLKQLDEVTHINIFKQAGFECEMIVARDLAFSAADYLKAQGIYRIEIEGSYLFLALMGLESKKEEEMSWDLSPLYDSFNGGDYDWDLDKLDGYIESMNKLADKIVKDHNNEKNKLEDYFELLEKISLTFERLGVYAELIVSANSKDEAANKYADIIDRKQSELKEAETKVSKWISEIKEIDEVINKSPKLESLQFCIKEIVENSKYQLSEKEEVLLARMRNTGSVAWSNYKNLLISTHKVMMEDKGEMKALPLTVVLNMAYDESKEVRKKAYEAEIASYKAIEEGIAAALNGIKGEVITVSELRGYDSPLDMTLKDSRMQRKTLDAMLEAMKESLPIFRKYLKKKAQILGYKGGLPFYELYAPVIKADMKYSYEQGKAFVCKQFHEFDERLSDYAKNAMDNRWIDVLPKEGKVGGAFCCGVHCIGESRILLNYGGTFQDTITMAHELGHGYHGECLKHENIMNTHYPMPLAETASTFSETIVKKAAIRESSKEQALSILETEISDCTQVIVDIYSRYLFETAIFEKRKEAPLTVEQIKSCMLEAQKEAYGDGLDEAYLHPYMWTWKSHYYYADANFYNFPYAFGLLFAKGLYAQYMKDKEGFKDEYRRLLSLTGKMTIEEVTQEIGIDISSPQFFKDSLEIIKEDIETFLKLSDELNLAQ